MTTAPRLLAFTLVASGLFGSARAQEIRGSFIGRTGSDTTSVERFSLVGGRLEGELVFPRSARLVYRLEALGDRSRVFEVTMRSAFARAGAPPHEVRRLVFAGDSIAETITRAGKTVDRRRYAGAAALPVLYPSLALLEMATRRARQLGNQPAEVPFVEAGYRERQMNFRITWIGKDTARLDLGGFEFRLAVDSTGRVLGGRFPAQGLTLERVDGWVELTPPNYTAPAGAAYQAEEVGIPTSSGQELAGTLTRPKGVSGRLPVVVTIPGSGQLDRDGTPDGFDRYHPQREMAEALTARGIAVLRYDKRGVGGSTAGEEGTLQAIAEDIRGVLRFLRARKDIDRNRIALHRAQ